MDIKTLDGIAVYILESLQEGDIRTGENLRDELRQSSIDYPDFIFESYYHPIEGKKKLAKVLDEIKSRVESQSKLPIIQLECHGFDDGILLSSKEKLLWPELFDLLRPVNIVSSNYLLLNLSVCFGDAVIRYIAPQRRAPFRAVVAPKGEAYPDSLQNAWFSFYNSFYKMLRDHTFDGYCQLALSCGLIYYEQEFVFDAYFNLHRISPEMFDQQIINDLVGMYETNGPLMISVDAYKKWKADKCDKISNKYKPFFCFYDLRNQNEE